MRTLLLILMAGLGAGCTFNPDLGGDLPCGDDAECQLLGQCTCLGGQCVPLTKGGMCGDGQVCEAPEVACPGSCANLDTDSENCGKCGKVCDEVPPDTCLDDVAQIHAPLGDCLAGLCSYVPQAVPCAAGCLDGACRPDPCLETQCPEGETCLDGVCFCGATGDGCPADRSCCGGSCVDVNKDGEHCGGCDNPCLNPPPPACVEGDAVSFSLPATCSNGGCQYTEEVTSCQQGCANGVCDNSCGGNCDPGETCQSGICYCDDTECLPNETCCSGLCKDLMVHDQHCGGCDVSCWDLPGPRCDGDQLIEVFVPGACVDGWCVFNEESSPCAHGCENGACLDDPCQNVGCGPGQICADGVCICLADGSACQADQICCPNGCLDPTSVSSCGACDTDCLALPAVQTVDCADQGCLILTCKAHFVDCNLDPDDGCEANIRDDPATCGGCLSPCANDQSCVNGTCTTASAYDGIVCGQSICTGSQTCCTDPWASASCSPGGTSDACAGIEAFCDGPEDCPSGAVCCFNPEVQNISCRGEGECQPGGVLCHPAETCPDGTDCLPDAFGDFTFGTCQS